MIPTKNAKGRFTPKRIAMPFDHVELLGRRVVRLNRMPDPLPPDALLGYLGRSSSGRAVILIPVDKLNSVPKGFRHRVQAVMPFWEPNGEVPILMNKSGVIYVVANSFGA